MKIKLLKDIPGYKAGEVYESNQKDWQFNYEDNGRFCAEYSAKFLVQEGFAELIQDDIDIEEIRKEYQPMVFGREGTGDHGTFTREEILWFTAYRIVKAVVEKLNGDWKSEPVSGGNNIIIDYSLIKNMFVTDAISYMHISLLPYCIDVETAEKVIELCEPELKILFGVK